MSLQHWYEDFRFERIDQKQAKKDGKYYFVTALGAQILTKECYEGSEEICHLYYYNYKEESNEEVLRYILENYSPSLDSCEIVVQISHGNFTVQIERWMNIPSGVIDGEYHKLLDKNNFLICEYDYNEQFILEKIRKIALDDEGKEIEFFYHPKTREPLHFEDKHSNSYTPSFEPESIAYYHPGFMEAHPYYKDGEFFPDEITTDKV